LYYYADYTRKQQRLLAQSGRLDWMQPQIVGYAGLDESIDVIAAYFVALVSENCYSVVLPLQLSVLKLKMERPLRLAR
jgi:hypothetical protein